MTQSGTAGEGITSPWDFHATVSSVAESELRLSRGFLRSQPGKWFPGFGMQWLPLAQALGVEIKLLEVAPQVEVPQDVSIKFSGTVDDEPLGFFLDNAAAKVILENVSPGALPVAEEVVLEYMARRFITSLALSWSGPESSVVKFDSGVDLNSMKVAGIVKVSISVNGTQCVFWLALGPSLVERLDGLWRRQIVSTSKQQDSGFKVQLEVAQLAVSPSMLVEYVKPGSIVDLEVGVGDSITLRKEAEPWKRVRLRNAGGKIALEALQEQVSSKSLPEGTTRLVVSFGEVELDPATVVELSQNGAMLKTSIPLGSEVKMMINGEKVADAELCLHQGRFALTVR